jgi:hypothetical protein
MGTMRYLVLAAALLTGCATAPKSTLTTSELTNSSYRTFNAAIAAKNNYGSYGATFYVKAVQDGSKLGLCGMYLLDAPAAFGQGVQNAFSDDRSWISVDGRKVATLAFLPGYLPNTPDSNRRAACVRTETDWTPGLDRAPIRVGWPAATSY